MTDAERFGVQCGQTYQARKGSRSPERTIIWISASGDLVQYDGPAVKIGMRYPTVYASAFAKWAGIVDD